MQFGDTKGAHKIFKISLIAFMIIGTVGALFLFIFSGKISKQFIQISGAKYSLIALSPSIFFVSVIAVFRGYYNGRQNFTITAKSQAIEQTFKTVFTIFFVELIIIIGRKNNVLMAGAANFATTIATICSLIFIIISYYKMRKLLAQEINNSVNSKPTRIRNTIKNILKVAIPISLGSLISSLNKNIDSFTVVRFLKSFLTEEEAINQYGILSGKVDSLCLLPCSLNAAFVTTLVPSISKSIANRKIKEVKKKSEFFILMCLLIGLPITSILFMFPNEILGLLFPNAQSGATLLKISSISIIFMLLGQTVNAILQGIGNVNIPPISYGFGIFVKLLCNLFLIKHQDIGIIGAIVGNIMCNITTFFISMLALWKKIKLKIELKRLILKPVFASFFMIVISNFIYERFYQVLNRNILLIFAVASGLTIYMALVVLLKIIKLKEIGILIEK